MAAERRRVDALPLFFFGTLMDVEVLGRVLGRPVMAAELRPARLDGFRRHGVVGQVYPVLREAAGEAVDGYLFRPSSREERRRIDHFEAGEYALSDVSVRRQGRLEAALAYRDLDGVFEIAAAPWCFATFTREGKAAYLDACSAWMADYVDA